MRVTFQGMLIPALRRSHAWSWFIASPAETISLPMIAEASRPVFLQMDEYERLVME